MRLPASRSVTVVLLQAHGDGAAHSIRLEFQARLGGKLIREGPLDQLAAEAAARRLAQSDKPGFLPYQHQPSLAFPFLDSPFDGQLAVVVRQRTVLRRVRHELV